MKHLVIYHANCMDGFGSAWCVWKRLGEKNVEFYPGYYGVEPPMDRIDSATEVIILDFSYPLEQMQSIHAAAKCITWLDHHHTTEPIVDQLRSWIDTQTLEMSKGSYIRFDQEHSGVTLAFEHYLANQYQTIPQLLLFIEDQDLWRFKLPETEAVSSALQSHPMDFEVWDQLIHGDLQKMLVEGRVIRRFYQEQLNRVVALATPVTLGGIKGMAVNASSLFVSEAGAALARMSGTFGLVWHVNEYGDRICSLRSASEFDVASLAQQYGGGGHVKASGFKCKQPVWTE